MKNAWQQSVKDGLAGKLVHLNVGEVIPSELYEDAVEVSAQIVETETFIQFYVRREEGDD